MIYIVRECIALSQQYRSISDSVFANVEIFYNYLLQYGFIHLIRNKKSDDQLLLSICVYAMELVIMYEWIWIF